MRLTKIKLAGFKSFVDPTQINFPSNLTGVVGPNGCGKSNVIDAVRWVMGELSAKHLRGDNMADVVFNGSSARKPVGSASVELIFDNADGKIGGAYAGYSEISLKRQVSRDGNSAYFINGGRCRRKDITNLFLGTGLGSRSYAIIEQGMISRVIDAKAEDMRAFVEEAAGISRYKERRKETEARIADTRENLERLQDVRDEVEKQIRHLQRQAATARRYQALKEQERRLTAEVLALKLRDLDSGAQVQDAALRERELALQAALAAQRAAEAALERQRVVHNEHGEQLNQAQGRFYQVGADISRLEQSIEHTRELRERQRTELQQLEATQQELASHLGRDEAQLASLVAELDTLEPQLGAALHAEQDAARAIEDAESQLQAWQQRAEAHASALSAAQQSAHVEAARDEELQKQLAQLQAQRARLSAEQASLGGEDPATQLAQAEALERAAHAASLARAQSLAELQGTLQRRRQELRAAEEELERLRKAWAEARDELTAVEALQAAALNDGSGETRGWLESSGLAQEPRLAARLEVAPGWERAVETVLGDTLEAVCVTDLEAAAQRVPSFASGRLTLLEGSAGAHAEAAHSLAAQVRGPAAIAARLGTVRTAESLAAALRQRAALDAHSSLITRSGEWVGRDWLRISRGSATHAGVLEREQQLKGLRAGAAAAEQAVGGAESTLQRRRAALESAEAQREGLQHEVQSAHAAHAAQLAALTERRGQLQQTQERRQRLSQDTGSLAAEEQRVSEALARARTGLAQAEASLATLRSEQVRLTAERDERRAALAAARTAAQALQHRSRELQVQVESRRSTVASVSIATQRMHEQRAQLLRRRAELESELAEGDTPILADQARLNETLAQRLTVEAELAAARARLEETEATLRGLDEQRQGAEQRVQTAREAMDTARLSAQETHVRRAALAEQFGETRCELAAVLAQLPAEAQVATHEPLLGETRADVERLGQVNLAAIDELKDHTQRKEYLDSQFADLTAALETLEEAMRRIDKETRTRFDDTFERINAGLREKFPRLFGGGHAYLELVGEDKLSAGVAVMARPPGKKNSTIHLLSGGEKALTAVALVFSIFDLNPAPFCLLDEVDAPLDEHNVGRFCDIVREMSSRVQFVFITHNKSTMELASQLIGVTMNEPGVSRLVTVDVDEAVRLAAV